MAHQESLKKIKTGALTRGLALAKVSLNLGTRSLSHAVNGIFTSEDQKAERLKGLLLGQMEVLSRELGQLKGSLMKVGQTISMYGEHFLPPEANQLLKSLQSQSPPLAWPAIEKVLRRQLGDEVLAKLEIDREPAAAASLGQVHRARRQSDGREIALKIQYPGVDRAIDSDIMAFKRFLSLAKLLPRGGSYDEIFKEVKSMLEREVDYARELEATDEFRRALASDSRFVVPETFPEFSTKRVLATSWEEGVAVDGPEVAALSQERRNALGEAMLDLYFRELYEFSQVQTDPHFGNYRVRLGSGGAPDQWVLLDFGAVRKVSGKFIEAQRKMVRAGLFRDEAALIEAARGLGFLRAEDPPELERGFVDLCLLILEPFHLPVQASEDAPYDWGGSDLPKRVARQGAKVAMSFKLRVPPREIVFLDRKMGGIFILLKILGCRFDARQVLKRFVGD